MALAQTSLPGPWPWRGRKEASSGAQGKLGPPLLELSLAARLDCCLVRGVPPTAHLWPVGVT